ncbi:MAG TPA: glycosyltransferase family 9 protein [Thermoanaerobaculia bacterium]|nr:glycosyltransferase family 9 protein [Thermoanaerobaculia bacterium]
MAALRASLPSETRLGWVVERHLEELVRLVAPVDVIFVASTRAWRRAPFNAQTHGEIGELRNNLRRFAAGQTSIDFQGLMKSAILGVVAGATDRIGFNRAAVRERLSLMMTNRRIPVQRGHVVELNMQLAAAAGASGSPPALDFSRFEDDSSGMIAACVTPRTVVLNPGAGHGSKQWGIGRFGELADQLAAQSGLEPLVIWGPGEKAMAARIAARSAATLAPETSLRELAFLLRRSRLMVSGDTGPLHLAAALGTPVVGLYGPTDPSRNGPWGQLHHCVSAWTTTRSLETITVAQVMEVAARAVGEV